MSDELKHSVHTMPLEPLRARAREADRLVEQARAIVRRSFPRGKAPDSGAGHQVGAMLDAIERLLPGIGLIAVQLTDRGGGNLTPAVKTEQSERDAVVRGLAERVASLLGDIERARSAAFPRTSSSVASSRSPFQRR